MEETLRAKISRLPKKPGCYLWIGKRSLSETDEILYVGKAKNLKSRATSYLSSDSTKTKYLINCANDIDTIVTTNETEALLLESTLVKKHNPPFNVRLKDDKMYPYICLTMGETFPRLLIARRKSNHKHLYFGPFSDVGAARTTLRLLHKIFPIRKRPLKLPLKKPGKPCLNFHLKRCWAPCTGTVDSEDYQNMASQIKDFMEGNDQTVIETLTSIMKSASAELKFEKAALYRNIIEDIQKTQQSQQIAMLQGNDNFDLLALHTTSFQSLYQEVNLVDSSIEGENGLAGQFLLLKIRRGRLIAKSTYPADGMIEEFEETTNLIEAFFRDYYLDLQDIPPEIYLGPEFKETSAWQKAFSMKAKVPVSIKQVESNDQTSENEVVSLHKMARLNAEHSLRERLLSEKYRNQKIGLRHLQKFLGLKQLPEIIECYDISNFQGSFPVAAGVMLKNGLPHKPGYRRYKITGFADQDDPGMMEQVINRRLEKLQTTKQRLPDLILIDGGITQLRAAKAAKAETGLNVPLFSLAKKEEVVLNENEQSIHIDQNSPGMLILRLARDEAHRFSVSYHRLLRDKATLDGKLKAIPGVGNKTRTRIIRAFVNHPENSDTSFRDVLISQLKIKPAVAEEVLLLLPQ